MAENTPPDLQSGSRENPNLKGQIRNVNIPLRNGTCEIRGGPLACRGTFVEVSTASPQREFPLRLIFVCVSASGDGRPLLKWWIGVNELINAASGGRRAKILDPSERK
jgi:hypothetical protein